MAGAGGPIFPPSHSPVVLTADQEDFITKRKTWNTGYKLWKLKSNNPQLFANIERVNAALAAEAAEGGGGAVAAAALPPGIERVSQGWLLHGERQLWMEETSQRCLWFNAAQGAHRDFLIGEDLSADLSLSGVATVSSAGASADRPGARSGTSASSASAPSSPSSARHLVIMDLHKVADVLKLDLAHVDRPAAMLAVYKHEVGALTPEVAVRGLHEKLLRRLAGRALGVHGSAGSGAQGPCGHRRGCCSHPWVAVGRRRKPWRCLRHR